MEKEKLFCKGGGCTAKLGAGILSRGIIEAAAGTGRENLLVGYDSKMMPLSIRYLMILLLYKPLISFHRWSMTLTLLGKLLLRMH